jgi:hypothetical protein
MKSPERMDNLGEPEKGELLTNSRIVVWNMHHFYANLEGIKPAVNYFEQSLQDSAGKNVLYLNNCFLTNGNKAVYYREMNERGLVYPYIEYILHHEKGKPPTEGEIYKRYCDIDSQNYQAIDNGLIPKEFGQDFFLFNELEKMKGLDNTFYVDLEAHSEDKIAKFYEGITESTKLSHASIDNWYDGDIEGLITNRKNLNYINYNISRLRELDVVDDVRRITKNLSRDKKNGVLYLIVPSDFFGLERSLSQHYEEAPKNRLIFNKMNVVRDSGYKIQELLYNGDDVPDELYLKNGLESVLIDSAANLAKQKKSNARFGMQFETFSRCVSDLVSGLPESEIRNLSAVNVDPLNLLNYLQLSHQNSSFKI